MTQPTADQFLNGGGAKSASFRNKPIGHSYAGTITEPPKVTQQTDVDDNSLLTWPNGEPKWQLVVKIATDLREDEDDDGVRAVYVKGKSLTEAAKEAAKPFGGKLLTGGHLTVTLIGEGEQSKKAFNPPRLYRVTYLPPEPSGDSAGFFGDLVASSAAPAAAVATHVSPGLNMAELLANAQAPAVGVNVPPIPAMYAGKVSAGQWAALPAEQRANLLAAAANVAAAVGSDDPPF